MRFPFPLLFIFAILLASARAASPDIDIGLTADEKNWIAAHPEVRVGHDISYAPYSFRDARGNIVGIDPDVLDLIAQRTGLRFRNETRANWEEVVSDFKAGRLDLLMSLGYVKEREAFLIYTRAYGYAPDVLVTRDNSPVPFEIGELRGRRIALVQGYTAMRAMVESAMSDPQIVDYPTSEAAMLAVARGEAFGAVSDAVNAVYIIKARHLTNLRLGVVLESRGVANENYLGVRRDQPELAVIVNKAIASITPAERHAISNRWVGVELDESVWSARIVRVAGVVVVVAVLIGGLILWHNRRLARELSERRRVQAELEQTHERLTRASEEKSELMHMLAHDLRNPLTAVVMGVDLLRLGDLPHEHEETAARLRSHAQKMGRLIDDLMDANAIESGQRQFHFDPVDLTRTVRAAVESFAEPAALKQLRLELALPAAPLVVQTDEGAFRQVVDNLLSNAVKYSPARQSIEIALVREGDGMRLTVTDHGPGMNADDIAQLFRKFGKGRAQPTGGEKSSGLGLWIVQRVVDALGGKVRCESEPGAGATFVFTLPLVRPAA
ncbi:MAG: transporter substrate-binding domain-containing protein [Opitutae bacterium]|nr:transporter substrate-binding domain-containing protein [Opitutae bacterium]